MTREELILQLVQEIRDDQKSMVVKLNELSVNQISLKAELDAGRNGYAPHEVVAMLHWIDEQMKKQDKNTDGIRNAVINWLIPILGTAILVAVFNMYKYF